ncbi:hypothetical protein BJ165DRAFT_1532487 [Panaeolus papilionaceus]|nr:hypothetical protein BJ165DRAFT_1532479 [Panaeolus papilionaceus]KAF9037093.1 hypothetical protein BJ165DRAFT_1532487 [Panaeolus papilionaceus]
MHVKHSTLSQAGHSLSRNRGGRDTVSEERPQVQIRENAGYPDVAAIKQEPGYDYRNRDWFTQEEDDGGDSGLCDGFQQLSVMDPNPPDRYDRQPPSGPKRRICYILFGGAGDGIHYNWASASYYLGQAPATRQLQGYSSYEEAEEAYAFFKSYDTVPLSPEHGGVAKTKVSRSPSSSFGATRSPSPTKPQPPTGVSKPPPSPSSFVSHPFSCVTVRSPARMRSSVSTPSASRTASISAGSVSAAQPSRFPKAGGHRGMHREPLGSAAYSMPFPEPKPDGGATPSTTHDSVSRPSPISPSPFFVVCSGNYPGVYLDYAEAKLAVGMESVGGSRILVADTRGDANQLFVDSVMAAYL